MEIVAGIKVQAPAPPPKEPNPQALQRWNLNGYVFDAWLGLNHSSEVTITQHPVETGAPISDNIFSNPKRFSFEIGMSDVMKSIIPGQFPASPTRVINAYNTLITMQARRDFVTLTSKYGYFENIIVKSVIINDSSATYSTMRATINLEEVIIAATQNKKVTLFPHVTDQTQRGQTSSVPPAGTLGAIIEDIKNGIKPE